MEEEIYSASSPIWDPEFKQNPPAHVTAGVTDVVAGVTDIVLGVTGLSVGVAVGVSG